MKKYVYNTGYTELVSIKENTYIDNEKTANPMENEKPMWVIYQKANLNDQ